jgi:protein SCO1
VSRGVPRRAAVVAVLIASLAVTAFITWRLSGVGRAGGSETGVGDAGDTASTHSTRPPILFSLPDFSLTERSGRTVTPADLRGKVCIYDFIFTRCPGACPAMTSRLAELQIQLSKEPSWGDIRFVSLSVDPDHDTPAVLREYARLAHADDTHWLMLTGPRQAIWSLMKDGFKLPVAPNTADAVTPILHSQKFVLVDRTGRVRGYYDALEQRAPEGGTLPDERAKLLDDLQRVLAER